MVDMESFMKQVEEAKKKSAMEKEKSLEIERSLREDVSVTFREPYPQEHEIELPRKKMGYYF